MKNVMTVDRVESVSLSHAHATLRADQPSGPIELVVRAMKDKIVANGLHVGSRFVVTIEQTELEHL